MICECKILSKLLKQYENQLQRPIQLHEFNSGKELLLNYIPGTYDVIFLDIFMNDENGVDCAIELRQLDQDVNLIFLTTSSEFGVKSYDVRAVDYIIKPPTLKKLSRALGYCQMADSQAEPSITVTTNHQPLEVTLSKIYYADFQNRCAYIHLEDCHIPVAGSFTKLSNQLTVSPQFMSCFKGIVINLNKVREICSNYLVLKNGDQLPISRRLQRQVEQRKLSLSAGSLRGDSL